MHVNPKSRWGPAPGAHRWEDVGSDQRMRISISTRGGYVPRHPGLGGQRKPEVQDLKVGYDKEGKESLHVNT